MTTLKELWDREFIKFTQEELDEFNVSHDTGALLVNLGLPKEHYTFEYSGVRFYNSCDFRKLTFNGSVYIVIGEISYGRIAIDLNTQEV